MSGLFKPKSQRTIFIVDDDNDMVELNRLILEFHGYKVVSASSGKEALHALKQIQPPDLILLDYNLRDMNGPEFLKAFEEKAYKLFHQVPIVFLTGRSEVPDSRAIGFIQKSSDMDGFLRRVDEYIPSPI